MRIKIEGIIIKTRDTDRETIRKLIHTLKKKGVEAEIMFNSESASKIDMETFKKKLEEWSKNNVPIIRRCSELGISIPTYYKYVRKVLSKEE